MTHDYEALAEGGHIGGLGMQRRSQGRDHVQQLDSFYDQGLISEVLYLVSIGKEASVYCCAAGRFLAGDMSRRLTGWGTSASFHGSQDQPALSVNGEGARPAASPSTPSGRPADEPASRLANLGRPADEPASRPAGLVAAKVFRARQYRFKNDAVYQEERTRGMKGQAKRALARKTRFGREVQTGAWVHHEYEVLKELHDAGCDVPRPLACAGDAILLEFIGDEDGPAPQLLRVELNREDAEAQFERTLRNVEIALSLNRIHGDLSAHNILWWDGRVVLIDFPQAVDARFNSQAQQLLERDVTNVVRYFSQFGVRAEAWRLARDLWRRYLRAEL